MGKDIKKQNSKGTALDTKRLLRQQKVSTFFTKSTAVIFLLIMSVIVLVPFYWMLNTSFKTPKEQDQFPPTLYPHEWSFENYRVAFLGKKKVNLDKFEKRIKENPEKIKSLQEQINLGKDDYDNALVKIAEFDSSSDLRVKYLPDYIPIYEKLKPFVLKIEENKNLDKQRIVLLGKIIQEDLKIKDAKSKNDEAKVKEHTDLKAQYEQEKLNIEKTIKDNKAIIESQEHKNALKEEQEYLNKNNQQKYTEQYLKYLNIKDNHEKLIANQKQIKSDLNEANSNIEATRLRDDDSFKVYIFHTLVVGISSTILGTFVSIIGAFALSRLSFKGKNLIFTIMLATMMIPGEMMVISNFITVSAFGWTDNTPNNHLTYLAMVVPFLVTVFHIYLLRQTFKQIPDELYYAAKVDGTGDFKYLWKVMVPLAKSSIITIVILKLMGTWNAYIWPNLVGKNHKLITVWLRTAFTDPESGRVALETQMAATVLVLLPLLFVFLFLRKYIMRGVSRGGTKG